VLASLLPEEEVRKGFYDLLSKNHVPVWRVRLAWMLQYFTQLRDYVLKATWLSGLESCTGFIYI
jgi:hypothetical protein